MTGQQKNSVLPKLKRKNHQTHAALNMGGVMHTWGECEKLEFSVSTVDSVMLQWDTQKFLVYPHPWQEDAKEKTLQWAQTALFWVCTCNKNVLNIPNKHVGMLQSIAIYDGPTVKRLWVRAPACCVWPNFFTSLHLWKRDSNRKLLHRTTSIKWGNRWKTLDEACHNVTLTKCSWNSQVSGY